MTGEFIGHLTKTAIPLHHTLKVPVKPHLDLQAQLKMAEYGTESWDVIDIYLQFF